ESDFACRVGEVEDFLRLSLVEQRRGFGVRLGGQQRERVLLRQVLADCAALVEREAVGESDDGNFAPRVTLHVVLGLGAMAVSATDSPSKAAAFAARTQLTDLLLTLSQIENHKLVVRETTFGERQADAVRVGRPAGAIQ